MNRILKRFKVPLAVMIIFMALLVGIVSAASEDPLPITLPIFGTLLLLGLYGAFEYAKQTWGSDPTKWDPIKYIQIFAAAAIVSIVLYLASGALTTATIDQITQALALLGGSVLTILGYKTAKNVSANGALINPAIKPAATAFAPEPAPAVIPGFELPRDGRKIMDGLDGWWVRLNPSDEAATLPDDKAYQAISVNVKIWSGDKDTVIYLVTNPDAAGWRKRFA
jgi:hypothetical protein